MKKESRNMLSASFFLLGAAQLLTSEVSVTGAVIGSTLGSELNAFIGYLAILFSTALFVINSNKLTSSIKKHPSLTKLAENATNDEKVQKEIDHLVLELSKGNMEAGLGRPIKIKGTKVHYLRGRNGGRLYYRKTAGTGNESKYEIVGKSTKGRNQDRVMNKIREFYS